MKFCQLYAVLVLFCGLLTTSCVSSSPIPSWHEQLNHADAFVEGINEPYWLEGVVFNPILDEPPFPTTFDLTTVRFQIDTIFLFTQRTTYVMNAKTELDTYLDAEWSIETMFDQEKDTMKATEYDALLRSVTSEPEEILTIARNAVETLPQEHVRVTIMLFASHQMEQMFNRPVVWQVLINTSEPNRQSIRIIIDAQTQTILELTE